jgi:predicted nucleic acid-binding protein
VKAVLVDTDVLIEVLRGREAKLLARWEELAGSDVPVAYSPVTSAEIWHVVREGEEEAVEGLLAAMICIPVDAKIGREAGEYLQRYRKSHSVELGDALMAATAVLHQMQLWTRNRKHYPMREIRLY